MFWEADVRCSRNAEGVGAGRLSPVSGPFQVWMHAVAHSPLRLEYPHR